MTRATTADKSSYVVDANGEHMHALGLDPTLPYGATKETNLATAAAVTALGPFIDTTKVITITPVGAGVFFRLSEFGNVAAVADGSDPYVADGEMYHVAVFNDDNYISLILEAGATPPISVFVTEREDGGLPIIFSLNSEQAQPLTSAATYAGSANGNVLTSSDNNKTFWYQPLKDGETPLHGLRRVRNELTLPGLGNFSAQTGAVKSGNEVTFPGSSQSERVTASNITPFGGIPGIAVGYRITGRILSGGTSSVIALRLVFTGGVSSTTDKLVTFTTVNQDFFVGAQSDVADENTAIQVQVRNTGLLAGTIEVSATLVHVIQSGGALIPSEYAEPDVEYGVGVNGVRNFSTTNNNSEIDGVVTEAVGATILGGGFLPEPEATNQFLQSSDFEDVEWTNTALLLTNNGINDLGLLEFELDAGITDDLHFLFDTASAPTAGSVYFIAKQLSGRYVCVRRGSVFAVDYACFDLQAGTITEEGPGISQAIITDLGNGWYKCEINTTDASGNSGFAISNSATPGTGVPSFLGSNETVLLCHAKFDNTIFSTPPIITSGAPVTQAASVLNTGTPINAEFGAVLDVTLPDVIGIGNTITLLGPDTTAEDILRVDENFNVIMDDGGTPVTIGAVSAGQRIRMAYGRDPTSRSASLDGVPTTTGDAPGAGHVGENFEIGSRAGINQSRCIHHDTIIYGKRPTDSELQDFSGIPGDP